MQTNIKHVWSLLCRKSIIDADTNNVSIVDVFEQLGIERSLKAGEAEKDSKKISVPIDYELVSLWIRDFKNSDSDIKGETRIEIFDPNGIKQKTFDQPFEIPSGIKRLRSRAKVSGFSAEESGIYLFKVSLKGEKNGSYTVVADIPLEVLITDKVIQDPKKK